MVKGIIAVALVSFWVVLHCSLVQGRQQDEMIGKLYRKMSGMASGKDEK